MSTSDTASTNPKINTLKKTMKTQIASMLKGVIDEENNSKDLIDEIQDTIFDQEEDDDDSYDEIETNPNTTMRSQFTMLSNANYKKTKPFASWRYKQDTSGMIYGENQMNRQEQSAQKSSPHWNNSPFTNLGAYNQNAIQSNINNNNNAHNYSFTGSYLNSLNNQMSNCGWNSGFNNGSPVNAMSQRNGTPWNTSAAMARNMQSSVYNRTNYEGSNIFNTSGSMIMNQSMTMSKSPINKSQSNLYQMPQQLQQHKLPLQQQHQKVAFGLKMPLRTFNFKTKNNILNGSQTPGSPRHSQCESSPVDNSFSCTNNLIIINDPIATELEGRLIPYGKFTTEIYNKIRTNFVSLVKSQQASRICQYYLDQTSSDWIHLMYLDISNQINQLIVDPYANYFLLKLFYFLNSNDRMTFLQTLAPALVDLSINKISTYPIQCIAERLSSTEEKELFFNSISNSFMKLAVDVYGTHVLEKTMSCFDYKLVQPLSIFILDNFLFLANHPNGLCVVKKVIFLEYKKDNFFRWKHELMKNAHILIQNPYGNYALQVSIDFWAEPDIRDISRSLLGKTSVLSVQKYSSNVIERCLEKSEDFLNNYIKEICANESTLTMLMKNNYGNYVIQTSLKTSNFNSRMILTGAINKLLNTITDKKLVNKWKSIISVYC